MICEDFADPVMDAFKGVLGMRNFLASILYQKQKRINEQLIELDSFLQHQPFSEEFHNGRRGIYNMLLTSLQKQEIKTFQCFTNHILPQQQSCQQYC